MHRSILQFSIPHNPLKEMKYVVVNCFIKKKNYSVYHDSQSENLEGPANHPSGHKIQGHN